MAHAKSHSKISFISFVHFIYLDPRLWSEEHVVCWLNWATKEFSLQCNNIEAFSEMRGREMIALGNTGFLAKAPPFTGDILWAHLESLLQGMCFILFFCPKRVENHFNS